MIIEKPEGATFLISAPPLAAAAAKKGWGQNQSPDPTRELGYSFAASAKYCSYTSSAVLALVTTSSTGASE